MNCPNYYPLVSSTESNTINICFLSLLLLGTSSITGIAAVRNLLFHESYGCNYSLKKQRFSHKLRYSIFIIYNVLLLSYTHRYYNPSDASFFVKSIYFAVTVNVALILPLILTEVSFSGTAHGAILFTTLFQIVITAIITIQDILVDNVNNISLLIPVSVLCVYLLEFNYYHPSLELLRQLSIRYDGDVHSISPPNIISQLTESFMNPMITESYNKNKLTPENFISLPETYTSTSMYSRIANEWGKELKSSKREKLDQKSLFYPLLKAFGGFVVKILSFRFLMLVAVYTKPQIFRLLIQYLDDSNGKSLLLKILAAVGLTIATASQTIFTNAEASVKFVSDKAVSNALQRLIFNKTLKLSLDAKGTKSSGEIINLFTGDVENIEWAFSFGIPGLVTDPLEVILSIVSLYSFLGNAVWAILIVAIVTTPLTGKLVRFISTAEENYMKQKDKRISIFSDMLSSIKSMKLYSWEIPLLNKLFEARNNHEIKAMKQVTLADASLSFIETYIPFLCTCTAFYLYTIWNSQPLTAELIFPTFALFQTLEVALTGLPEVISILTTGAISLRRIREFLILEEVTKERSKYQELSVSLGEVKITNASFLWSPKSQSIALKDINYIAEPGKLSCIVGKVGSGKSTFLKAILGELPYINSDPSKPVNFSINGSVAYCAQKAWIMNTSVKQNILFNTVYDDLFYHKVLEACELVRDMSELEDGDETIVGERGISLSGGQKQRIALARALYLRADIYVLDDILSAVDSHVSAKLISTIFDKSTGLLAKTTTILATNNIKVLSHADHVVLLENGTTSEHGTYSDIRKNEGKLAELIKNFGSASEDDDENIESALAEKPSVESVSNLPDLGSVSAPQLEPFDKKLALARLTYDNNSKDHKLHEKSQDGRVAMSVYKSYISASGYWGPIIACSLMVLQWLVGFAGGYWLKRWSELNSEAHHNVNVKFYILIYGAIGFFMSFGRAMAEISTQFQWTLKASQVLHDKMTNSVFHAPMSFFETTPVGRVMNRFTGDVRVMDFRMGRVFILLLVNGVSCALVILVIGYTIPLFLILIPFFLMASLYYQRYYAFVVREIRRFSSIATSPIMSQISETIAGDETLRAFTMEKRFDFFFGLLLDNKLTAVYNNSAAGRWVVIRMDLFASAIVFMVSCMAAIGPHFSYTFSTALIGLILSYTMQATDSFNLVLRFCASVETLSVSVERILEYCELPKEAPLIIDDHRPPISWPSQGCVEFENFSTGYSEDKPVLKNLNLKIESQEKVGIVGRTGAGKTTMTAAIFRLIEPMQGKIKIDGIDISELGLFDLRSSLNIIPQDSQLFVGTIRQNLDPLNRHSDQELEELLKVSHLDKFLVPENDVKLLDYELTEAGENLSVGQKQLLCLSRALLNPSKILILDEATAAIDVETDKIIQESIREVFADRTIITIAHRLDTIMDYDKVLVLDSGEVKEFDRIEKLLEQKDSLFYLMCEKGGYLKKGN